MTARAQEGRPGHHHTLLAELLSEVVVARENEAAQGRLAPRAMNAIALWEARQATLDALLDYAAAIEALSWPVPRSMVLEIQMHRIVCARRPWAGSRSGE